eukprot:scaffold803_cov310-Pinguiococcus_pyrenoidosus.AAC.126
MEMHRAKGSPSCDQGGHPIKVLHPLDPMGGNAPITSPVQQLAGANRDQQTSLFMSSGQRYDSFEWCSSPMAQGGHLQGNDREWAGFLQGHQDPRLPPISAMLCLSVAPANLSDR